MSTTPHRMDKLVVDERVPGMSLRGRDLSAVRRASISLSITDAYSRSPKAAKLTRAMASPLAVSVFNPVDNDDHYSGDHSSHDNRRPPMTPPRDATPLGRRSPAPVARRSPAPSMVGKAFYEKSQVQLWGAAAVVFLVLWLWLSAMAQSRGQSASGFATHTPLNVSSSSTSDLNQALLLLEKRALALASRDADAKVAPLVARIEELGKGVARSAATAQVEALVARIVALEGLTQQLGGAHNEHSAAVKDIETHTRQLRQLVEQLTLRVQADAVASAQREVARENARNGAEKAEEDRLNALVERIAALESRPVATAPPSAPPPAVGPSTADLENAVAAALESVRVEIKSATAGIVTREEVAIAAEHAARDAALAVTTAQLRRHDVAAMIVEALQSAPPRTDDGPGSAPSGLTAEEVTAMIERAIRTVQSDVQDVASTVSDAAARAASEAVERLRDKSNSLSAEDVEALVRRLLEVERADQLARKDYAFKVVHNSTSATWNDFSLPAKYLARVSGVELLTPPGPEATIGRGERTLCWPFSAVAGGNLTVELREPVAITAVAVEHPKKAIAHDWRNAPKDFDVFVYPDGLGGKSVLAGSDAYDVNGATALQVFRLNLRGAKAATKFVRIQFRANHGATDYTCIYRVRVFAD